MSRILIKRNQGAKKDNVKTNKKRTNTTHRKDITRSHYKNRWKGLKELKSRKTNESCDAAAAIISNAPWSIEKQLVVLENDFILPFSNLKSLSLFYYPSIYLYYRVLFLEGLRNLLYLLCSTLLCRLNSNYLLSNCWPLVELYGTTK